MLLFPDTEPVFPRQHSETVPRLLSAQVLLYPGTEQVFPRQQSVQQLGTVSYLLSGPRLSGPG